MATEAGTRAGALGEYITNLLGEFGIRVPEDIEAEVIELIEKTYADVEEKAWMYDDLCR